MLGSIDPAFDAAIVAALQALAVQAGDGLRKAGRGRHLRHLRGRSSSATEVDETPPRPDAADAGDLPRRPRCARAGLERVRPGRHQAPQAGEVRPGRLPQGQARRAHHRRRSCCRSRSATTARSATSRSSRRPRPTSTPRRWPPPSSSCSSRPRSTTSRRPSRSPTATTSRSSRRSSRPGPQINFDGVVLERFKKKPLPRVTVSPGRPRQPHRRSPTTTATSPSSTCRPGRTRSRSPTPGSSPSTTEETITVGKRRTVKYLVEEKDEGVDDAVDRARAAHQEGGGRDAHPHRGGAARPRHAGRHAQGRAEPPGRGALVVRLGRAHRLGLGAQRHQGQRRRRRDPDALPRGRLPLDDQLGPGPVDRSFARLVRRRVRPRPRRPGAHRSRVAPQGGDARLRRRRRARHLGAASPRPSRPGCGWRSPGASATSISCCRWSPRRTSATSSPSRSTTTTRRAPRWRCGRTRSWR